MAKGHWPLRRAQPWRTVGIETLENLHVSDHWQHLAHRLVETDAAAFDELHRRGCRYRLRHRSDAKYRVRGHAIWLVDRPAAESAFVKDALVVGSERRDPRNRTRLD